MINIHNGLLLSHKKEWNPAIWSNMDGPREYHTEWSDSQREKQIPYDITYIWNLKYDTNKPIYKIETDSGIETDLWLPRGRRVGRDGLGVWN